jgi:hypothetical protein
MPAEPRAKHSYVKTSAPGRLQEWPQYRDRTGHRRVHVLSGHVLGDAVRHSGSRARENRDGAPPLRWLRQRLTRSQHGRSIKQVGVPRECGLVHADG